MGKKYFFGWTNIKWFIKEFIAMYSNEDSYFSKKRFESSVTFIGGMGILLCNVYYHRSTISNSEVLSDAVILFTMAGYTVSKIQAEKKDVFQQESNSTEKLDQQTKDEPAV